jgi:hypothetical protein
MTKIAPILPPAARRKMLAMQQSDSSAASKMPKEGLIAQMRRNGSTPRPNPFANGRG